MAWPCCKAWSSFFYLISSLPANNTSAPHHPQCGGYGAACKNFNCADAAYTSATCISGTSCKRQNQYYYQCL